MTHSEDNFPDLVDAHSGEICEADAIFLFGTQHWAAAELAAGLYFKGLAPSIITTGGPHRHPRQISEGEIHRDLLIAAGVPADAIFVENASRYTHENVSLAVPLLEQIGPPRSLIAVVKWFHRRAVIALADQVPTLQRIYAADYEPFNWNTREGLARATWRSSCQERVAKEVDYLTKLRDNGTDLLQRTPQGWTRTNEA